MSKTLTAPIALHIAAAVQSLCSCWKITRTDGVILTFTDAQSPVVVNGVTYASAVGFDPSAVETTTVMAVDNLEVSGLLTLNFITAADVSAGVYDAAEIELFYVNRLDPNSGTLPMKRGTVGQITWQQGTFKAEVRGLMQPFHQNIVEIFSASCRATLGDNRCKVALTASTGTVATVTDNRKFTDTARTEADGTFGYGKATFTSGLNTGYVMEVKTFVGGVVELLLPMPRAIAIGDTYTLLPGCDRAATTCRVRFNNLNNFRGEPDIPDPAVAMYPSSK